MKHFESTYDRITRESKAEGIAEGKAEVLLRLVRKRFGNQPAEYEACIRAATITELDQWTDRVLDVESAAYLFTA